MYVYKVTHIPTGKYYLGLSTSPKSTFDAAKDLDPYNQFELYGNNGTRLKMVNVEKRIISLAGDANELASMGADVAKSCQDDPLFLGLKGQPASIEPKVVNTTPTVTTKTTPTT
jgi:hypothetical protein